MLVLVWMLSRAINIKRYQNSTISKFKLEFFGVSRVCVQKESPLSFTVFEIITNAVEQTNA